jgi:hypothetical protein
MTKTHTIRPIPLALNALIATSALSSRSRSEAGTTRTLTATPAMRSPARRPRTAPYRRASSGSTRKCAASGRTT